MGHEGILVELANDVNDHDCSNFDCPHLFFELARGCYRKEPQLAAAAPEVLVSCDCILRRGDVSAYVYIPMFLNVAHALRRDDAAGSCSMRPLGRGGGCRGRRRVLCGG